MQDHLSSVTYQQLTSNQAQGWLNAIELIIRHNLSLYHYIATITTQGLEVQEMTASGKFILHHLDLSLVSDPLAYFYLLPKVHKKSWSTCPIVSVSSSLTYVLDKWLDSTLQEIIALIQSMVQSGEDFDSRILSAKLCSPQCSIIYCWCIFYV